jgi:acetyltransferase-like isoleucine patch superfamily enzyme
MNLKRISIVLFNILRLSLKLNLWSTIYFNFKTLPFKQAVKFPFHFFGRTDFANLNGKFIITDQKLRFGMIVFGGRHEVVISSDISTRIYNTGSMEFKGNAFFGRGVNLMVWDHGELTIGNEFALGTLSRVICFRKITFGKNVLISWECQFFDTDFHFIETKNHELKDNCGEIEIQDESWIGARSTILKNTMLANSTIVGANSLCSGHYSEKYGSCILIAGIPAKLIKSDVSYITDKSQEKHLFAYFALYKNQF